jgi:hypothetical protein
MSPIGHFVRRTFTPSLSPHAAAVDRLCRVINAVLDAQEMLERLERTGPDAIRSQLAAPIADLDWTTGQLSAALRGLEADGSTCRRAPAGYAAS